MTISIKATNLDLTPALKDYAEKRLRGITKFIGGEADISVDLGKTTAHHKQGEIYGASVAVVTPLGKHYIATSEKADMYEAIDDARDEIVREINSAKGRHESLLRRGSQKIKSMMRGTRAI